MRKLFTIALCCIAAGLARAEAPLDCASLAHCLSALDKIAPGRADGHVSDADKDYAAQLERFGDPAKRALLARAAGEDRGWRELASGILAHWQAVDARDVPALIAALKRQPNSEVAYPLARIGTPEAIAAIADDVRAHSGAGPSGNALAGLGPRALPFLLAVLEDGHGYYGARYVMEAMKDTALAAIDPWLAVARDKDAPKEKRLAALHGIGILGQKAGRVAPEIRAIYRARDDEEIAELAGKVLQAMGDPVMAGSALDCRRSDTAYWPYSREWPDTEMCLSRAAAYGPAALPYANWILTGFAGSDNGGDRASAASALGFIGYGKAQARLREMLRDPDWHVVYAALRALGWLGAKDALGDIDKVATSHWLEAVRDEARAVALALRSPEGALARPKTRAGTLDSPPDVDGFGIDATNAPDIAPCASERWRWNGKSFAAPEKTRMGLAFAQGTLAGSDHGEWGGELVWTPSGGEKRLLFIGNVEGIEPAPKGGAVVVFGGVGGFKPYDPDPPQRDASGQELETIAVSNGPSGIGFAILVEPDASGAWRISKLAVLPRAVDALATIGDGLYAAWSGNRAVVFSRKGVEGVAECVAR